MKNKKETNTILSYLLLAIVIICSIYFNKKIYIEPNKILEVSISNLLYPFTFLLTILIYKKNKFKETHKIIIKTTLIFFIFTLLVTLLNNIPGNYYSTEIDTSLKKILTPTFFLIKGIPIYTPNILNIITYMLMFYFSHIILIILYEAMEPYTYKFVAFALAMFIPYALDTICLTTISSTLNTIELNKLIINLTSNFVLVIIFTIIITILYVVTPIKKVRSNH